MPAAKTKNDPAYFLLKTVLIDLDETLVLFVPLISFGGNSIRSISGLQGYCLRILFYHVVSWMIRCALEIETRKKYQCFCYLY